jgi:two-component system chemotaxis response regulator CheB
VVLVSPGGRQTRVKRRGVTNFTIEISDDPPDSLYKPAIDIMMSSVAEAYPGRSLGVILTGMGHDGLEGMTLIRDKGGKTLVQDEASCIVYGMPKAVIEAGIADKIAPIDLIAGEIVNMI